MSPQPPILTGHVYTIQNKASGTFCNLCGGRDSDGTPIWGWADQSAAISTFDQQWLVVDAGTPGEYILRNVRGGTYMDLDKGSNVDGTIVHGSRRAGISQQWIIEPSESDGYMRVISAASRLYLDLHAGLSDNGNKIQGWRYTKSDENQLWKFTRVSRDGGVVNQILQADPHVEKGSKLTTYLANGIYIGIPDVVRDDIWASVGLNANQLRDSIFDCSNDFAFVAKAAIAKWARDYIRADKISILFGIVFARDTTARHAYNFHLTPALDQIVWYEPQQGVAEANPGYKAHFGTF